MANCNLCGKKIGLLENQYSEFTDDTGVCIDCHNLLKNEIKPQITNMIKEKSYDEILSYIIDKYIVSNRNMKSDFMLNSKEYIKKYIDMVFVNNQAQQNQQETVERQTELRRKALSLKITTGYSFDGYKIVDYKGVVSGEIVVGTGIVSEFTAGFSDFFGTESNAFAEKMRTVKEAALTKLKMQSALVDGNAVIGVDFDYLNFSNNMIGISANGTAVVVEKVEE